MSEMVSQMQEIIFDILCDVDDYCKENNIRYFLSGGTCLGAVRHQGFIPWDDDGDIMIPRPDYYRFMKGFKKKYREKYGVGSLRTERNWTMPNGKIWSLSTSAKCMCADIQDMGVFIDVFPIDGLPESKISQTIIYKRIKVVNVLRNASIRIGFREGEKYRTAKKLLHFFCKRLDPNKLSRVMEKQVARYNFDTSKYVAVSMMPHYGSRETIEQKHMSDSVLLTFNGRLFPVPKGYDVYLHNLYDDYMTPKGEGKSKHISHWQVYLNKEEEDKNG